MGLEVQNCCCCFKLETGAKIISIFEIIGGFLLLIGGVAGLGSDPLVGSYVLFEGRKWQICYLYKSECPTNEQTFHYLLQLLLLSVACSCYLVSWK